MIRRLLSALSTFTILCKYSSLHHEEKFRRLELQSLDVDFRGEHIANEFQLINHEAIYESKTKSYSITDVFPLTINNNDVVKLSYSATLPKATDWLAAYSPADVDITKTVPVKFALCSGDPTYLSSGVGQLSFNFTNLRDDIIFHYFTGSLLTPVLVATFDKKVSFINNNEALRPRIVPVGSNNPDTYKLLWNRCVILHCLLFQSLSYLLHFQGKMGPMHIYYEFNLILSKSPQQLFLVSTNYLFICPVLNSHSSERPLLRWGTTSGILNTTVIATTSRVERHQMCGSPANSTGWRDGGLIHTALLSGMIELGGKSFFYIFGDDLTNDFSEEMVFFVPAPKGVVLPSRFGSQQYFFLLPFTFVLYFTFTFTFYFYFYFLFGSMLKTVS